MRACMPWLLALLFWTVSCVCIAGSGVGVGFLSEGVLADMLPAVAVAAAADAVSA